MALHFVVRDERACRVCLKELLPVWVFVM